MTLIHRLTPGAASPPARAARAAPGPDVLRLRCADAILEGLLLALIAEVLRELAEGPMRVLALEDTLGAGRLTYAALARLELAGLVQIPHGLDLPVGLTPRGYEVAAGALARAVASG
jgi:hypothetical protein